MQINVPGHPGQSNITAKSPWKGCLSASYKLNVIL